MGTWVERGYGAVGLETGENADGRGAPLQASLRVRLSVRQLPLPRSDPESKQTLSAPTGLSSLILQV